MAGLEFTLVVIFLAITYIFSYAFSSNGVKSPPIIKQQTLHREYPIVVIIGATSSRGQKVLNLLKDRKLTLVAVSRRETRWLKMREQFPNVSWYRGDVRLSTDMNYLFEQIKLHHGSIDYVINLTYIPGKTNTSTISSLRVKDNVFCKLSQAYDPELLPFSHAGGSAGEESPLFTNIIGCVVLKNTCITYGVHQVIMMLGNDTVVNELIKTIERESGNVTKFFSLDPVNLEKINEMIQ